jgi:putative transposase
MASNLPPIPGTSMARPLRLHIPGALYHVMSRGNAKQPIFFEDEDYEQFLDLLSATAGRFRVLCRAYCLMQNHFHLLLEPSAYPLSRMMQQLNSAYGQGFNRRHNRVGHVLQGRFKALLVDRDEYFLQVLRYIVLNPVEAGLVSAPAEWRWSSYRATAGLGGGPAFLALDDVWKAFDADVGSARGLFADFVGAGPCQTAPPGPVVFGSTAFTAQVGLVLEPHREIRDISRAERFAVRPSLDRLFAKSREGWSRDALMREAFRRHGYTLREIGELVGLHPSTVWRRIRSAESRPPTRPDPANWANVP